MSVVGEMRQRVWESPEFRADVIASQAEGDIRLEPIEFVAQVMTASLEQQRLPRLTTIGMS
jgi:hypothetical protein